MFSLTCELVFQLKAGRQLLRHFGAACRHAGRQQRNTRLLSQCGGVKSVQW